MRNKGREFTVGIVFFLLLGALGVITFVLGADVLKSTEPVSFRFDDVAGLTLGSEVWINGLPSGTVKEISITPDGTVVAGARMRNRLADIDLSNGAVVEVREKSSLGGAVVSVITLKKPDANAPKSVEGIQARIWTAKAGGFASVGQGAVDKLVRASKDEPGFLGRALLGDDGMKDFGATLSDLRKTIAEIREWVEKADKKDSALAVILNDPETGRKLRETVDDIHDITRKANSGEGLVGKLLNDAETSKKFDSILDDIKGFTADLKDRNGSLYKLMHDPSLFDDAKGAIADFRKFGDGLNDENGTLYRVVHDRKLADDLSSTVEKAKTAFDNIDAVTADIRNGKGTLGKLVNDPTLYDDLRGTLNSVQRTFEESRENAPILTFAGFLFRAF